MAVLSGSWLAMALKMGKSGNVEAMRGCCSRGGIVIPFQRGREIEAVEDNMRRATLMTMMVSERVLLRGLLRIHGEARSASRK
jgi:hypothetical protein